METSNDARINALDYYQKQCKIVMNPESCYQSMVSLLVAIVKDQESRIKDLEAMSRPVKTSYSSSVEHDKDYWLRKFREGNRDIEHYNK